MTRRQILALAPGTVLGSLLPQSVNAQEPKTVYSGFPSQDVNRVRAVVGAAHRDLEMVKKLVGESPALAKAAYDWGFGDWETALGAASHTGRREIADFLIANGARPDIFYYAMIGHLEVVKAMITAEPRMVSFQGPHGLTLMSHAKAGGDEAKAVVAFLETVTDADKKPTDHDLTEAAKEVYIGRYSFGNSPDDFLEVVKHRLGYLQLKRGESGNAVRLNRVGEHEFAPGGAPAVRVRFVVEASKAQIVTIQDPEVILAAKRT